MSRLTAAMTWTQRAPQTDEGIDQLPLVMSQSVISWQKKLANQQYSAHTLEAYQRAVVAFGRYLVAKGQSSWSAKPMMLQAYIAERLESNTFKVVSAKQTVSALTQFYEELTKQDASINNPTIGYQLKKNTQALPKIADVDVIHQLLDQSMPDDPNQARLWVRDRAMFELMYSSGLRVSELASLEVTDVDLQARLVRVIGKGNKMRQLPVGKKACEAIDAYLPHRALWQEQNDTALFISERLGIRLTTRAIQLRLKTFARLAGIEQNFYPHLLRHCFASHMLSASGDLRAVQELLGHANASTTQIYTHVDFMALTKIYDTTHPRAIKSSKKINNP
ncbi:MAG: tyrosine recombinase XerC [Moraxella sp.]|nr:tyrosine recombinase XerC [Moraxella sp.]